MTDMTQATDTALALPEPTALATMAGRATPEAIADALMDGKIPHCEVRL